MAFVSVSAIQGRNTGVGGPPQRACNMGLTNVTLSQMGTLDGCTQYGAKTLYCLNNYRPIL